MRLVDDTSILSLLTHSGNAVRTRYDMAMKLGISRVLAFNLCNVFAISFSPMALFCF